MGHRTWERAIGQRTIGPGPGPNCPMSYGPLLSPMSHGLWPMSFVLCPMSHVLCPMSCVLCSMAYGFCNLPYAQVGNHTWEGRSILCPMACPLSCGMPNVLPHDLLADGMSCGPWVDPPRYGGAPAPWKYVTLPAREIKSPRLLQWVHPRMLVK